MESFLHRSCTLCVQNHARKSDPASKAQEADQSTVALVELPHQPLSHEADRSVSADSHTRSASESTASIFSEREHEVFTDLTNAHKLQSGMYCDSNPHRSGLESPLHGLSASARYHGDSNPHRSGSECYSENIAYGSASESVGIEHQIEHVDAQLYACASSSGRSDPACDRQETHNGYDMAPGAGLNSFYNSHDSSLLAAAAACAHGHKRPAECSSEQLYHNTWNGAAVHGSARGALSFS
jgi:hypothetical protein